MIRQLIIPGFIAAAAHAALFFSPHKGVPPPPPTKPVEEIKLVLPDMPIVPPDVDDRDERPAPMENFAALPVLTPIIVPNVENVFAEPFNPTMDTPKLGQGTTMVIPPGYRPSDGTGLSEAKLINFADLENKPRTLFQAAPDYPYPQKQLGNSGEVTVVFTVNENGYVEDVRVVRSSHPDFEAPTIRAVSKWKFEPGRKDGRRVKFRMSVPVAFNLNEDT